jgi:metal-dependent HD superfamily phosphatase/phosphodiesterase
MSDSRRHPALPAARPPAEAIEAMRVDAPTRGNRRLEKLFAAANADPQVRAWWHVQQVTADRLGMSDHSWIHIRIVLNVALRILRLLVRRGVVPNVVSDYGMNARDAEVVVAAACLLHDSGMSIHRAAHEEYSLFLAADKLPVLLADAYAEPERSVVVAEALGAIIGHRRRGEPVTLEAGVVRVADALDMEQGRSRVPFEEGRPNIHSLSAARIEIAMNNSSGLFQVDELLATKLRGSGLEEHVEVVARIDAEHEKRLLQVFRI